MKNENQNRCAGYGRVSSDLQTKGYSMKDQRTAIEDYCRKNKLELVKIFEDPGKSGSDIENRCGLKRLLMAAEAGEIDVVVVKRYDRLSRDLYQSLWIEKELTRAGVQIISIEQNVEGVPVEMGRAFKQIVQVFAELEKNMLVRKMAVGKARKFKEAPGPVCGNVSYGYKTSGPRGNRILVEDPEEQKALKLMKKLRRRGWSYGKIAKAFNGEGKIDGEIIVIPARPWGGRETKWHAQKIYNALHSNHDRGKVAYQGKSHKMG